MQLLRATEEGLVSEDKLAETTC